MSSGNRTRVGIIGSGFEADIHAESLRMVRDDAEIVAVASPTPGKAKAFAAKHDIPRAYQDYRDLLHENDVDMVTIAAPNYLHAQMTVDAALAGKHVLCEKPLCMTIEEADEMVETCQRQGVLLMYAEELLFTPKYVKAKEMADQGASSRKFSTRVISRREPAPRSPSPSAPPASPGPLISGSRTGDRHLRASRVVNTVRSLP